ncbi:MAG: AbrB/MazE/SpoVT family DNA-binding domain-containing protein [Oscillospiraceae bacterium]|nr:AbrB/MazE/SpoVT family DNA-binding domain-containing protein [Oscillospiraceae bacterium]
MEMAKVTSKGQITIPVSIRRRLNIDEGDKLLFIDSPDGVVMVNPNMLSGGVPQVAAKKATKQTQKSNVKSTAKKTDTQVSPDITPAAPAVQSDDHQESISPAQISATSKASDVIAPDTNLSHPESLIEAPAVAQAATQESVAETSPAPVQSIPQETVPEIPAVAQAVTPESANIPPADTSFAPRKTISKTLADAAAAYQSPDAPGSSEKNNTPSSHGLDLQSLLNDIRSIGSSSIGEKKF